jgi:hypothetical protein
MSDEKPKRRQFLEGDVLDAFDGGNIARSSPTSIVVVAGPARCGKTTLVGGLYELFHRGPFGGYLFAGSRTLPGFEQRCHLARIASGRDTPDTERTARSEGKDLLHLRLAEEKSGEFRNVLFSDIYGEAFRRAADVAEDCQKFTVLKRACHVAVLVDGEKVADRAARQSAFASADSLIGQCLDCGMFNAESSVQVVITKWDVLAGNVGDESFADGKLRWLDSRYAQRVGRLTSHKVSIRPPGGVAIEPGHGMADLITMWAQVRWPRLPSPGPRPRPYYFTEFDRSAAPLREGELGGQPGG